MKLFERIFKEVLNESGASENKINRAIDTHRLVVIRYNTHGERVAMANRLCGVFAYGVTKAGNDCIRVFEYKGDTTTFVPAWKLIRLDRILSWFETKQTISSPPMDPALGEFNPNGDGSMSIVYKVAKFEGQTPTIPQETQPTTATQVKTGTKPKEKQKQSVDAKKAEIGLKPYQDTKTTVSNIPKTAKDVKGDERVGLDGRYGDKPTMKTDTEKAIDYLRRQLDNPEKIDLSKFAKRQKQPNVGSENNVKVANPTAQKPIERVGLDGRYTDKPTMKTDTETAIDSLRKQLENPKKIDLSRIPKR